ncbi:MAG: hypothetical protein QM779_06625 [Propionicimonas sp.]|uniref:hypothetical protein n=1 Tax=Propionicimonas sp. TaxID=1955623 RepID=UPI003D101D16
MAELSDRDAEFSTFLDAASAPLAEQALRLAGDGEAASDLLHRALVRTYVSGKKLAPQDAAAHVVALMRREEGGRRAPSAGTDATVEVDRAAILDDAHEALRGRRMALIVAGLATLAVVASIVVGILITALVPGA